MLGSNAREQCSNAQQGGIGTDGRTDELTKSLGHLTGDNTSSVTRGRTYEFSPSPKNGGTVTARTCNQPGCERAHHSRGMCNTHYTHWLKANKHATTARTRGTCQLDGCNEPHKARGWCSTHYYRATTHGDPHKAAPVRGVCTLPDCNQPHSARGWCDKHYKRWLQHGDPTVVLQGLRPVVRDYYAEEVEHLASFGTPPERIVSALGVTPAALARALYRAGRNDLANPFQALTRQTQKKEAA